MITLQVLRKEQILPVLPIMHQWTVEAFQRPPYSAARVSNKDIVDPQDTIYINDPEALVVIATHTEEVVGVAAGIPFDSRHLRTYFESRNKSIYENITQLGFDPSQIFYITYILTAPKFENRAAVSCAIFDAFHTWATELKKKYLFWFEDASSGDSQQTPHEKAETWKDDVGGFTQMSLKFNSSWPTYQPDGSIKEQEHMMNFFFKEVD